MELIVEGTDVGVVCTIPNALLVQITENHPDFYLSSGPGVKVTDQAAWAKSVARWIMEESGEDGLFPLAHALDAAISSAIENEAAGAEYLGQEGVDS